MIIKVKCQFPTGTFRFATQNLQDSTGNWQNKIVNISSLNRSIGEDKSYEQSGMSIEFSDSDRFFRFMMSGGDRFIAGKTVEIMDSGDTLIYRGNIEKWEFKEDSFTLFINDLLLGLDNIIPASVSKEEFANVVEEADGSSIPIIYGTVKTGTGAVKCWKVDTGKYLLAAHHCTGLEAVFTKDGIDKSADFELSNEGTQGTPNERAFINYTGTPAFSDEYILADVKGKSSGGDLIEHPMQVLEDVFSFVSGMNVSTLNRDNNWAVMTERNYVFSGVIDRQKTVKEFLVEFAFSFDCDFYISKENEVVIALLNWDTLEAEKKLTQQQVTGFQMQELPDSIRNKITYQYRYDYAAGKYTRLPLFDNPESISNWGEFYNKNEPLSFAHTYDDTTAYDVMQRYTLLHRDPLRKANVDLPLDEFTGLDIADVIEIQHPGAIDESLRKYQVRRIEVDFAADSVQMECTDITSLAGNLFILCGDDFPELWSDVQIHESRDYYRQFGYLCDDNGFFPNGDEGKILY